MSYLGSIVIGRDLEVPFNTKALATGAPITIVDEALRLILCRAGDWRDFVTLAIGSTDTAVSSTAFHYAISGTGYSKAAVAAGTALAAGTIPQDKWGLYLFSINAAGTIACTAAAANFTTGYDDEATAIAALPATPASSYSMGYVTVLTEVGAVFIGGTDALQGGVSGNPSSDTNYYVTADAADTLDDDFNPGRGAITGFHKASIDITEAVIGGAPGDELLVLITGTVGGTATDTLIGQATLAASTLEAGSINLAALASDVTARLLGTTAVTALNRAFGVAGVIGSTGNDTTHLHLDGLTYGNDEINGYLLVIYDDSEAEYHFRWITDWVLSSELASVATLPFTPEDATDTYALIPIIKDADVASILEDTGTTLPVNLALAATFAGYRKNTERLFPFVMTDSTNHATLAGLTVTATRSLDGAAFGACANAVSAISNGAYKITLAAADLNADVALLRFTGPGADDLFVAIKTQA